MTVRVSFECGGCFATADGTKWLQRRVVETANAPGGGEFVRYRNDTPQDVAPAGWIAFDPYTGCCYCPACWASVTAPVVGAK